MNPNQDKQTWYWRHRFLRRLNNRILLLCALILICSWILRLLLLICIVSLDQLVLRSRTRQPQFLQLVTKL